MSDIVLRALSQELGAEWQPLATNLGCSREEIERHRRDHLTVANQIFNLLVTWRQRQPSGTDVKKQLATALRNSERKDLADLLQSMILWSFFTQIIEFKIKGLFPDSSIISL